MCNYCSHGTLLRNSALQVLAGVFATATKICTHGGSTRALALTASKLTVASFLLVGSTLGLFPRRSGTATTLSAIHFQG